MDRNEIFEGVKHVLVEDLIVEPEEVTMQARYVGDLGAESVDHLSTICALQKYFGITEIPSEDIPKGNTEVTVEMIVDYIEKRVNESAGTEAPYPSP